MTVRFDLTSWTTPKKAFLAGFLLALPFTLNITQLILYQIFSGNDLLRQINSILVQNGRGTVVGLAVFYISIAGLALAPIITLLPVLKFGINLNKWNLAGNISLKPQVINIVFGAVTLFVAGLFIWPSRRRLLRLHCR